MTARASSRLGLGLVVALAFWVVTATGQQPAPAPPSYVPGEIIVKFKPGASTARRNAVLARRGAQLVRKFESLDIHRLRLNPGDSVQAALAAFRGEPDVVSVQPNYIRGIVASSPPDDPFWVNDSLYGLIKIKAQPAWNNFPSGDGTIVVADIDTGVNYNHPDLAANVGSSRVDLQACKLEYSIVSPK